jgi:hypothetical protein
MRVLGLLFRLAAYPALFQQWLGLFLSERMFVKACLRARRRPVWALLGMETGVSRP